jgi:stage II sporulation protein D
MRSPLLLLFLFFLSSPLTHLTTPFTPSLAAAADDTIDLRVGVEIDVLRLTVGTSVDAPVTDLSGKLLLTLEGRKPHVVRADKSRLTLRSASAQAVWINPGPNQLTYINRSWYRGRVLLIAKGNKLTAVNYVNIEHYLYSVLGCEMSGKWPLEALKAQAVAARTYALHKRAQAIADKQVYDLGSTARWQVYRGVTAEAPKTRRATRETAGLVLTWNNKPILAAYHSSSGGHTESVEHIWGMSKLPYLTAVPDYDQKASVYRWTLSFTPNALSKKLKLTHIGDIRGIKILDSTPQGHVNSVLFVGSAGSATLSGRALKSSLDLRSTRIQFFATTTKTKLASGRTVTTLAEFIIQGRGFGHGVGMSQFGAKALAEHGYTYAQILAHYYRGAKLSRLAVRP